ncbi:MAG: hypothetical protein ACHQ50_17095, partial [Fimbriimonadales bacterium]
MLLATLAFVAGLIQEAPLARRLKFSAPADSVRRVLANFSQKTGHAFTVAGPIAKDIIVLRFNDVSVKEAMAKIAEATTAEWLPTKDGYRLERTAAVVQRFHDEARDRFAPFLRTDLDKTAKEFQKTDGATEAQISTALSRIPRATDDAKSTRHALTDADSEVLTQTPGERLLIRIAESIGAKRLAAIAASGQRTVFAVPATARQELLTGIDGAIEHYVAEHNRWTRAADRLGRDTLESIPRLGHYHPNWQTTLHGPPSKVFVALQSGRVPGSALSLDLKVFDAHGMWVDEDSMELLTGPPYVDSSADENRAKRDPERPIKLSHNADLLVKTFDTMGEHKPKLAGTDLMGKLCRPDRFEPLTLMASEIILKAAEAKRENLAACLPDDDFEDMANLASLASLKPTWVVRILSSRLQTCTEHGGWIVSRPDDPFESTNKRADRAAIASLIATCLKNKHLTTDDWAQYAVVCPFDYLCLGWSIVGCTVKNERYNNVLDGDSLRLIGSLSTTQRRTLDTGRRLLFREMTARQRAIVDDIANDEMGGVQIEPDDGLDVKDVLHVLSDPSQLLPNGIDSGGFLQMTTTREHALLRVPATDAEGHNFGIEDLWEFAVRRQPIDKDDRPPPDLGHMRLATKVTRYLHLSVAKGRACDRFCSDSYAPPGPVYTLK